MRLLTGVVLFMVLARVWGVETFGIFAYLSTATLLLALIVDYGYAQQLLRDIGYDPSNVSRIVSEAFATKVFLTAILVVLSALLAPLLLAKHLDFSLFFVLLIAAIFNSFAEFFNVAFRGLGRFNRETSIVTATNSVHFVVIMLLAYLRQSPLVVAWGFMLSRGFYLYLSWRTYRKEIGPFERGGFDLKRIVHSLKTGFYFCADAALTNFYAQVDTLIVNSYLGPAGVGIYQAGLRLMLGANTFTQVLSSVYLPVVSYNLNNKKEFNRLLSNMYLQMLMIGGLACAVFIVGAKFITSLVYGPKFAALAPIFPYFGLLLLFRYLAAVHGVTLTATGLQGTRVYSILLAVIALAVSSFFLVPRFGLSGMLVSSILAIVTLHTFYVMRLVLCKIPLGLNLRNSFASAVVFTFVFVAFVSF
ncbi:hypothetical protein GMSM_17310 [Geomonas sp. Red276]